MGPTMTSVGYLLFDTAIGRCGLSWGPTALTGVLLPEESDEATRRRMQRLNPTLAEDPDHASAVALNAVQRIRALLQGERDDLLDLPLDMSGLASFNRRVYETVRRVGPGRTITYGELAARLGEPGAARAVGQALSRNPFAPVVPCHRVLAAPGASSGYRSGGFSAGGGVSTKLRMLQIEGARLGLGLGLFD